VGIASVPGTLFAHDIKLPLEELELGVSRVDRTLQHYRTFPAVPPLPQTEDDQRKIVGAAEIELALGNHKKALGMLMARIEDPKFRRLPEYVDTLLFTSQILETTDEDIGAMKYAEMALGQGGTPNQMAEAGARWFRVARRHQRLDRRLEIYELWRVNGGEKAAGSEVACQVAYEVAFALRADGRRRQARQLLARVPSDSGYGSRAAYLAGVLLLEDGDLHNAERWFEAIMDWPLPQLQKDDPQLKIEIEARELAAIATGRLRYERGELEAAAAAYDRVAVGSPLESDACWERAYLDLDRRRRRGALENIQCVLDRGAEGAQYVNARLFRASMLAHLSKYGDSIKAYEMLHEDMVKERDQFAEAAKQIDAAGEFLFSAMERNAVGRGKDAAPGPGTLFGGAWTAEVDSAYRVDRGTDEARTSANKIADEVGEIDAILARDDSFKLLDVRRTQLERLIREIQHLLGHAGDLQGSLNLNASSRTAVVDKEHEEDSRSLGHVIRALNRLLKETEADLASIDRLEADRRAQAAKLLGEIRGELRSIDQEIASLERDSAEPVNGVARKAIEQLKSALRDAAMKAEVGVLDTYWLKKEHRTQEIESLLDSKKQLQDETEAAVREIDDEEQSAPDQIPGEADHLPMPGLPAF
jgi:hypothetical protein